jgi:hypothetical protein
MLLRINKNNLTKFSLGGTEIGEGIVSGVWFGVIDPTVENRRYWQESKLIRRFWNNISQWKRHPTSGTQPSLILEGFSPSLPTENPVRNLFLHAR